MQPYFLTHKMFKNLKTRNLKSAQAFTLIELLVVIAVLAVLSTAAVLVINPAELIKRSRDSRRLQELNELNKAISLLVADKPAADLGLSSKVYISLPDSDPDCLNILATLPPLPSTGGWGYKCATQDNFRKVDGFGWIPANLTALSTGSPLATLPIDPVNTVQDGYYYTYVPGGSWKLTAVFEAKKTMTKMANDGGPDPSIYETGSNLNLANFQRGLAGYWKMDEEIWTNNCSTNTVNDSSGNGNHGKSCPNGTGPTGGAIGKVDKAGSFDGVDDYVDKTSFNIGTTITLSAWIKSSSYDGKIPLSLNGDNYPSGPNLYFTGSKIVWNIGDGATNSFITGYPDSNWHLFVA